MSRKVYEVMFSLMLEDKFSKDQILEMYFNTTYFGNGATGITAAARSYFGKTPAEMNLAECAALPNVRLSLRCRMHRPRLTRTKIPKAAKNASI